MIELLRMCTCCIGLQWVFISIIYNGHLRRCQKYIGLVGEGRCLCNYGGSTQYHRCLDWHRYVPLGTICQLLKCF